jgi:hypothetical protein
MGPEPGGRYSSPRVAAGDRLATFRRGVKTLLRCSQGVRVLARAGLGDPGTRGGFRPHALTAAARGALGEAFGRYRVHKACLERQRLALEC